MSKKMLITNEAKRTTNDYAVIATMQCDSLMILITSTDEKKDAFNFEARSMNTFVYRYENITLKEALDYASEQILIDSE